MQIQQQNAWKHLNNNKKIDFLSSCTSSCNSTYSDMSYHYYRTPSNSTALAPVPYRQSKLTHLLKDALGGNAKTSIIAHLRCESEFHPQSSMSLIQISRAYNIRNRPIIHREIVGNATIVPFQTELERLQ